MLLAIDRTAADPLHAQVEAQLRAAIQTARLPAGAPLPPSRTLARQLGVSRGVVVEAYEQLVAEGYLTARTGAGTRVSDAVRRSPPAPLRHAPPPRARHDFHPGHPDLARFPQAAWLRALRGALRRAPYTALGYGDARGAEPLREVLAAYLGRVRGTVADPQRTVVTSGQMQGLGLVLRALKRRGARRVALEDPGFFWHRASVAHAGLEAVPVPVDDSGLRVDALAATGADAVVVTPAHQSPTGVVLAADRRAALLAWAERERTYVVEDDYDAEYRFDREPIGALQGLAPERVVYSGSASKTLAPALRLGWLLLPLDLADAVIGEKTLDDLGSPLPEQLALAEFVERGELDRHVRRMRPLYEERRAALAAALDRHVPQVRLRGVPAGLHTLALLPEGTDENALVAAAMARGIFVQGLASAWFDPGGKPPGLVLGYGNIDATAIEPAVAELASLLAASNGRSSASTRSGLSKTSP
jgi:GntR family transcriptional regulator/MocR family aminotransferase